MAATTKYNAVSFFHDFFNNTIKKKEYSNYYVIIGPECNILMLKPQDTDEKILAVRFRNIPALFVDGEMQVAWRRRNVPTIYEMLSRNKANGAASIPTFNVSLQDIAAGTDITKASMLDVKTSGNPFNLNNICLFDIDGQRKLIDTNIVADVSLSYDRYKDLFIDNLSIKDQGDTDSLLVTRRKNRAIHDVSSIVKTIGEARLSMIPDGVENGIIHSYLWFVPAAEGFEPEGLSDDTINTLREPPTPYKFGLSKEFSERVINNILKGSMDWDEVKKHLSLSLATKLLAFIEAYRAYNTAQEIEDKEISDATLKGLRLTSYGDVISQCGKDDYDVFYFKGRMYKEGRSSTREFQNVFRPEPQSTENFVGDFPNWHTVMPMKFEYE